MGRQRFKVGLVLQEYQWEISELNVKGHNQLLLLVTYLMYQFKECSWGLPGILESFCLPGRSFCALGLPLLCIP